MHYHISKNDLSDFDKNIRREWVLTNGLGGYAGSSVLGAHNRTHQAYLIACLRPPVSRYVVFSKTNESFVQGGQQYDLTTAMHFDHQIADGYKYLEAFDYDGTVCFTYKASTLTIKKYITLVQRENTCAIAYEIENSSDETAKFCITPLMNFREHSDNVTADSFDFEESCLDKSFTLIPKADKSVAITVAFSDGKLNKRSDLYDCDMQLQTEVDNEVDGLDTHYMPYDITFEIPADSTYHFSLACNVTVNDKQVFDDKCIFSKEIDSEFAFACRNKQLEYIDSLIETANFSDQFASDLAVVANQFLAYRQSTGYMTVLAGLPWFTDWGRDTMIAFTGLTLSTRQYDSARDILLTFSKYVKNGMIPNMFPDDGQDPLYNTADASLWYFYAAYNYLKYIKEDKLLDSSEYEKACDFIKKEIYPCLIQIVDGYKNGTDFSIYMDDDCLIHAGGGFDQVTWMDVRVGDWVPTPRHGKPVEINALWYNALKTMEFFATQFGDNPDEYVSLADKVKQSFVAKFWNENDNCLYDVIEDGDKPDPTIRPNQIYAVSLPFTMLPSDKEKAIVDVVNEKLYVGVGLRSLDPDHKDYHPIYLGALAKRDAAYHQGTAWGFLLGGFVTAYTKVYGPTPSLLDAVKEHLTMGCIGSISEIFDGDLPHTCRGCYAQAWSVGEVLRCYTEDLIK